MQVFIGFSHLDAFGLISRVRKCSAEYSYDLMADVEGVKGVTDFLRAVVNRGGRVVSVHFALDIVGLKLVAEDREHRVLVYGAA